MDVYPVTVTLPDGTEHRKVRLIQHADGPARFYAWDPAANTATVVFESADPLEQTGRNRQGRQTWALGDAVVVELCKPCNAGRSPLSRWMPPDGRIAVASQ